MRQLVYAILATHDAARAAAAGTVQGLPLAWVAEGPLTAACSAAPDSSTAPAVPQLLAFARMVEGLFAQATVLPLRYGCWLESEQEIRQLLTRNATAFQTSLQLVHGCVEMEISILPQTARVAGLPPTAPPSSPATAEPPPDRGGDGAEQAARQGTVYLLARRQRYTDEDARQDTFTRTALSIQNALTGLFVKSVAEQHAARHGGLWSLYFLVRRPDSDRFRRAFTVLQASLGEKLLLTGPWPPYNFVSGKTPGSLS